MKRLNKNLLSIALLSAGLIASCSCQRLSQEEDETKQDVNENNPNNPDYSGGGTIKGNTDNEDITPIDPEPENTDDEDPNEPKLKLSITSATVEVGDTFKVPFVYKNYEENDTNGELQILGGSSSLNDTNAIVHNLYNSIVLEMKNSTENYLKQQYENNKDGLFNKFFATFTANKVGEVEITLKNNVAESKCTITVVEKESKSISISSHDFNVTRRIRNESVSNGDPSYFDVRYNYYAMGIEKGKSTQLYVSVFEDHNLLSSGINDQVIYTPSHPEYFSVSDSGLLTVNNNVPYVYGGYCFNDSDNLDKDNGYYHVTVTSKSNPLNSIQLRLCIINRDIPTFALVSDRDIDDKNNIFQPTISEFDYEIPYSNAVMQANLPYSTNMVYNPNNNSFSYRNVSRDGGGYTYKDYITVERKRSNSSDYIKNDLRLFAYIPEVGIEKKTFGIDFGHNMYEEKYKFLRFTLESTNETYFKVKNNRSYTDKETYDSTDYIIPPSYADNSQDKYAYLLASIMPQAAYTRSNNDSDEHIKVNFITNPKLNTKIYLNVKNVRE